MHPLFTALPLVLAALSVSVAATDPPSDLIFTAFGSYACDMGESPFTSVAYGQKWLLPANETFHSFTLSRSLTPDETLSFARLPIDSWFREPIPAGNPLCAYALGALTQKDGSAWMRTSAHNCWQMTGDTKCAVLSADNSTIGVNPSPISSAVSSPTATTTH